MDGRQPAERAGRTGSATPVLPGGLPLLGVLPALARDPLAVFERARALGDVVRLPVPGRHPLFVLGDPAHIRQVLQDNQANYRRTPFHDRLKPVLGEGLLTSEGALWQRQRRLLQPAFRAERIRRFVATMAEAAAGLAERWEAAAETGRILDVSQEMSDLTLEIALRCMFGAGRRGGDAALSAAVHAAQDWVSRRFWSVAPDWTERLPTPANRRFRRALATLDAAVAQVVAERLARGEAGEDLLGLLLAAQGEEGGAVDARQVRDEATARQLRDDATARQVRDDATARQVRDEAMTMILAGHETSAAALTWTFHLLAQHPEAEAAIRAEVADTLAGRAVPEPADLNRLSFARAVVQEAMRLYPPAGWFGRLAAAPDRIGGHDIPAGAILVLSPWALHRDPRLWPDPARFDPARFAEGTRPAPYAYFPFGGGPRTCIGNHFAMTEMLAALAVLVPRLSLRHASAAPVRPELLVTLRPAGGLPMRAERVAAPA